jgi:hypothetical protein
MLTELEITGGSIAEKSLLHDYVRWFRVDPLGVKAPRFAVPFALKVVVSLLLEVFGNL